ncbi:MAG: noncanonical pyrimidine nucleotidase, YjjG family [Bacteroidetes bacterium]|nr:MAG: noncanonical pyrimidine nucleotidase, YjjG family [Bacteroidota bacterium]
MASRSKKYKHLFFDLDHTLWDFEANAKLTLNELYYNLDLLSKGVGDFEKFYEIYLYHNERLWDKYRKGIIKRDELRWKRMWLTLVDCKINDEELAREMGVRFLDSLPTRTLLFPYAIEILEWLSKRNYSLHLITNGFEVTQYSKLRYSGLEKFFNEVITSEASNSLKPNPEIFEYAFQKTGALPGDSLMLGDDIEADIIGAQKAGMDQVYVNHKNIDPPFEPTYTISNLKELENIL